MTVTKVDTPSAAEPLDAADTIDYTITVTNDGNLSATNVIVTDTPVGTVTIDTGSGCRISQGSITSITGTSVTANLGTLAVGQTETLTYTVTVDTLQPGQNTVVNQATVTDDQSSSVWSRTIRASAVQSDPNVVYVEHDVRSRSHEDVGCNRTGRAWRRDHLHRHRHEQPARTP